MQGFPVRYSVEGGLNITISGHRQELRVCRLLGFDPNIHSGFAGRGRSIASVTQAEFDLLKANKCRITRTRKR